MRVPCEAFWIDRRYASCVSSEDPRKGDAYSWDKAVRVAVNWAQIIGHPEHGRGAPEASLPRIVHWHAEERLGLLDGGGWGGRWPTPPIEIMMRGGEVVVRVVHVSASSWAAFPQGGSKPVMIVQSENIKSSL